MSGPVLGTMSKVSETWSLSSRMSNRKKKKKILGRYQGISWKGQPELPNDWK